MRKWIFTLVALVAIGFLGAGCDSKKSADSTDIANEQNENDATGNDEEKDAEFAVDAADGGLFEVQLGNLAAKKASAERVRQFAQLMVTDHTKANDELKALASQKGIALPDVISEERQEDYYALDQKSGEEFDREYIDMMVKDHKDVVDRFERAAENLEDVEIRTWAETKLPTLRHHLEEAERIQDSLNDSGSQS